MSVSDISGITDIIVVVTGLVLRVRSCPKLNRFSDEGCPVKPYRLSPGLVGGQLRFFYELPQQQLHGDVPGGLLSHGKNTSHSPSGQLFFIALPASQQSPKPGFSSEPGLSSNPYPEIRGPSDRKICRLGLFFYQKFMCRFIGTRERKSVLLWQRKRSNARKCSTPPPAPSGKM